MITRNDIFEYVNQMYEIQPDYPWRKFSNYAVLRHQHNRKWFLLIMNITADKLGLDSTEEIDILNVKVKKEFIGALRQKAYIYPAYHMDKSNWVTIKLNAVNKISDIKNLIEDSYTLTS